MNNYIFIDGSSIKKNNKLYGGIGVFYKYKNKKYTRSYSISNSTNQKAELYALYYAIKLLNKLKNKNIIKEFPIIISDSQYVINIFSSWLNNWISKYKKFYKLSKINDLSKLTNIKDNKENSISNLPIIIKIYNLIDINKLKFKHVHSHKSEPSDKKSLEYILWFGNSIADKLACNASNILSKFNKN